MGSLKSDGDGDAGAGSSTERHISVDDACEEAEEALK